MPEVSIATKSVTQAPSEVAEELIPAPRASVIIVGYNSLPDLEKCLPSLLASVQDDPEIILVDNASTDGSSSWVQQSFPEIKLVISAENLGFGGACNLGAKHARGRYLAFLNPDTILDPGWLKALIAAFEADPQAGLATSKILLLHDPGRINTCGNDIHLSGITLCRGMGQPQQVFSHQEEVSAVSGACFAIRRQLFEALGGFDETFFMYMEDTDLSWRARLLGYKCLFVPESVVYHDYTLHFGPRKTFYQERNRYLMLLKNLRWPTLLILLPAFFLADLITWGYVLLHDRKNLANKFLAYAWIVQHWPEVMAKRRVVQASRRTPDRPLLLSLKSRLDFEQTDQTWIAQAAHLIFDPLFYSVHSIIFAVVKW